MNIGIVTSFYNGYDRFLPRWTESIIQQTAKPTMVVLVASGPVGDENNKNIACDLLESNKIPYLWVNLAYHKGMGFARNLAVMYCATEWVMYLDVDDTILPDGIQNIQKYQDEADVICTGLKVIGDRHNKNMRFLTTTTESIKAGKHGSCSHSPFKKSFWEKSPYIENNDYCEQPLWLGFAQAGASFIGTKEICTVYHSRSDGHNLSMTKKQKEESRKQFKSFVEKGVHND